MPISSDAYSLIRYAILNKNQIVADYRDHARFLCPHVLGKKGGREQALFYQFAGQSSTGLGPDGDPANWRCMFIEELSNVTVQDGDWHTAPNHSRPQTCVDDIDAEVSF